MFRITFIIASICFAASSSMGLSTARADEFSSDQIEYFEKNIRPMLVAHCYECHSGGAKKLQANLRLDFRDALLRGGDSGAVIEAGKANESLLIHSVRYESYEMPPKGKLSDPEIALFEQWINDGAAWPSEAPLDTDANAKSFDLEQRKQSHWAWQPLRASKPPAVKQSDWPTTSIDAFILNRLEDAGLSPAPPIDRRGLIRRLSLDLIGLPPASEDVDAFVQNEAPDAVEQLVDSLLKSPHFGERWGRHWLDLVRYAESRGHEFDHDATNAFQYRDYVIRAFNADVPYDQFVMEHIAGDLVDEPRLNPDQGYNESILATGFWFLGEWVHSPVDIRKDESDRFDNMIDVMSKTFLGLTVACARCHDHKFDAISTADYYALSGFLQSSDFRQVRFESFLADQKLANELAQLDQDFEARIRTAIAALVPKELHLNLESFFEPLTQAGSGVLVDYSAIAPQDYLQDGHIFGPVPIRPGQLVMDHSDEVVPVRVASQFAAVSDRFWDGLQSNSENAVQRRGRLVSIPMSGRTLRTPTVVIENGNVFIRVKGAGHIVACVDSHRLIAGPLHGETVVHFNSPDGWTWTRMNLGRYLGHGVHFEFVPDEGASLAVSVITQDASNPIGSQWRADFEARERGLADAASKLQQWLDSWLAAAPVGDPVDNALLAPADESIRNDVRRQIQQWREKRLALRQQLQTESQLAMAMIDSSSEDDRILVRGNASSPGVVVPRRYLAAIDGEAPISRQSRSGRLELAQRINDPANPQAARVMVNRIWHHLMGRGIVPTTDDFGVLGQVPTHPELLDHLAGHFLHEGRSIKRMIRMIVSSKTYQMSSQVDPTAVAQDPKNLLWHHRSPKRLDGEAIRDSLLAISGRLDPKMHGQSVPIHLTTFMEGRGRPRPSGPLDGDGRRSIYIAVRRNFLSPFMLTFDSPVPFSTMGRRNVSNVPAQSLILMNDPFVVSQAKLWATRILDATAQSTAGTGPLTPELMNQVRIQRMYKMAFSRPPTKLETELLLQFVHPHASTDAQPQNLLSRWTDVAHSLINTKEFIFLR